MKKMIALGLCVLALACSFVSCGKTTCDACGKENVSCKEIEIAGEKGWLCEDCYKLAEVGRSMMGL